MRKTGGGGVVGIHIFLFYGATRVMSHFPCLLGYSAYIGNIMTANL
jgi:hypothetical protein